jgi:hypothetical protein
LGPRGRRFKSCHPDLNPDLGVGRRADSPRPASHVLLLRFAKSEDGSTLHWVVRESGTSYRTSQLGKCARNQAWNSMDRSPHRRVLESSRSSNPRAVLQDRSWQRRTEEKLVERRADLSPRRPLYQAKLHPAILALMFIMPHETAHPETFSRPVAAATAPPSSPRRIRPMAD